MGGDDVQGDAMRAWLQKWFGLFELRESLIQMRLDRLRDREQDALRHIELVNALSALNKRMVNEHIGTPRQFTEPVLDWETVQAIALANLQANPEREN